MKKISLLLILCLLTGCFYQEKHENEDKQQKYICTYQGEWGSAGYIKDHTIIVSIFANDQGTKWDFKNDQKTIDDTFDHLKIATNWIKKQVKQYHVQTEFIYDWKTNRDLLYKTTFSENMIVDNVSMYHLQKQYIEQSIDSDALRKKYKAENIIYMFFFNTDFTNQINPWSLSHSNGEDYNTEIINIFVRFDDIYITPPASYAHEIMHCFGAHDLYYENAFINQDYVDHCYETCSNDIMYSVCYGDEIIDDFSELDAYYMGIIDSCEEVSTWHLALSDYQQ